MYNILKRLINAREDIHRNIFWAVVGNVIVRLYYYILI